MTNKNILLLMDDIETLQYQQKISPTTSWKLMRTLQELSKKDSLEIEDHALILNEVKKIQNTPGFIWTDAFSSIHEKILNPVIKLMTEECNVNEDIFSLIEKIEDFQEKNKLDPTQLWELTTILYGLKKKGCSEAETYALIINHVKKIEKLEKLSKAAGGFAQLSEMLKLELVIRLHRLGYDFKDLIKEKEESDEETDDEIESTQLIEDADSSLPDKNIEFAEFLEYTSKSPRP